MKRGGRYTLDKTRQGRQAEGCHKYLCEFWEQQCRRRLMLLQLHMRLSKTVSHTPLLPPTASSHTHTHSLLLQLTMSSRIHLHLPHPRHVCSASWASASLGLSFCCHAHRPPLPLGCQRELLLMDGVQKLTQHPPAKAKQLLCRVQLLLY